MNFVLIFELISSRFFIQMQKYLHFSLLRRSKLGLGSYVLKFSIMMLINYSFTLDDPEPRLDYFSTPDLI